MNAFSKLENKNLPKVQNGYAEDIPNFFKCIIKFQFENKEEIRKIHSSLFFKNTLDVSKLNCYRIQVLMCMLFLTLD